MAMIAREMPVNKVAELLKVGAHRIWRVFSHWVNKARDLDNISDIRELGIDETSTRKGHKYVTVDV